MLQIQKPKEQIICLIGKQTFNSNEKYRFLHFCINIPFDDKILLFNNLTKEFLVLEKDEYEELKNSNFSLPVDTVKTLVEQWFLVLEDNNDLELCEQIRSTMALFEANKGINQYTILTTTGCNARCFYCFEAGAPVINMDITTANAVADYIIRNCKGEKVLLNWFGGEPLCNHKVIDIISQKLCDNNISYYSTMVSNGYLFNEDIVKKSIELWKIKSIQITLDGMADTYNKVKNYANNDNNAFNRVIENMHTLCENKVAVKVRLNIDSHNYDEMISLIEFLNNKFKKYKDNYFLIYISPLFEYDGAESFSRNEIQRIELTQKVKEITQFIDKLELSKGHKRINNFATSSCMADRNNSVLIQPDGKLGFCEHYVSSNTYGTIYEDVKKSTWSAYQKRFEECKTCAYLPSCLKLEKCPTASDTCYEYTRFLRMNKVTNGVIEYYKKYLKSLNEE